MSSARRMALALVAAVTLCGLGATAASAATRDVCASGCSYATVQAAVDAATAGDTISVAAGTYTGNVVVNKANLTIDGAGSGSTTLTAASGNRIAPGVNADGLTVSDLKITGGGNAVHSDADTDDVTLLRLVVDGVTYGVNFNAPNTVSTDRWLLKDLTVRNTSVGVRFSTRSVIKDIEISGGLYENNGSAVNGSTTVANAGFVDGFDMHDGTVVVPALTTSNKGLYFEALKNATIEDVDVGGTALPGYPYNSGIELNEKYAAYSNITLRRVNVHGAFTDVAAANAQGISIKARNDAPSYNANPASLTNVRIVDSTVTGNQIGVGIGNDVSDIAINRTRIVGNTGAGVLDYRDAGKGALDAKNNWWGCNAGPTAFSGVQSVLPGRAGGCDTFVSEQANGDSTNPRLRLTATTSRAGIAAGGQTATVTAGVQRNSAGEAVADPIAFPAPPTVQFATTLGTLGDPSKTLGSSGAASVLTSGVETGTATVTSTLDGQSVTTEVSIADLVTATPPSNVTTTTAALNATIAPTATAYQFLLRKSGETAWVEGATTNVTDSAAAENVSDLSPATTYYYKVRASLANGGFAYSDIVSFKTLTPAPNQADIVVSQPTDITTTGATLGATVDTHGAATTAVLEWGTSAGVYTKSVALYRSGDGDAKVFDRSLPTSFAPGTTYHYRITTTNAGGSESSTDQTFTTLMPAGPQVTIGAPGPVAANTATVNTVIDAGGIPIISSSVQWGTTTSYGKSLPLLSGALVPEGRAYTRPLISLKASTTYHYKVTVTTATGTYTSGDLTFTTTS